MSSKKLVDVLIGEFAEEQGTEVSFVFQQGDDVPIGDVIDFPIEIQTITLRDTEGVLIIRDKIRKFLQEDSNVEDNTPVSAERVERADSVSGNAPK